ncbi:pyridoxamine 5'-phosphate oxidase [Prauserella shujinwangii]|uniref:Pyridoxamine 5'-phosphate oxidase n=1 Tax=Prauserella shujinwangii TaxID=1453103 RepID=A0A2T0LVC2_9PSEU|nr:pyridoxal 5'-phosphate synthase [Prauserella shujinwangii]PRX47774.1 pyridoxamine 5'-phosphate oxidase [Prauserella shujinwangii]
MSALRGWPSFPAELPDFDPDHAPALPHELFAEWLHDAGAGGFAPHAMTLSTVDENGDPDARVLILKDVDSAGWYFATSALSPKARQLAGRPRAALTFFWPHRARQVRVRGAVGPLDAAASAADFRERPFASRVEAFVGGQSEVLASDNELAEDVDRAERALAADPGLVPGDWTRYRLTPEAVEFWQGRHDRRHVRLRYTARDGGWHRERLRP